MRMRIQPQALLLLSIGLIAACTEPVSDEAPRSDLVANAGEAAAPLPAALPAIPARFRGRWDASASACAGPPGEMRLTVASDRLLFHESEARVLEVRPAGRGVVAADLELAGEGESWRETRSLRLLPHGQLEVESDGIRAIRVRCGETQPAAPAPAWEVAASGDGASLSLVSGDSRAASFFCPRGSGELLVNVPAFRPVASEERMSLGSGGTVVALVADTAGDARRGGVTGRGPVPAELETILAGAEGIGVNYGAQNGGPYPRPPAGLARRFAAACRA